MVCPQCVGSEKYFNAKFARRELKRYLNKGPIPSTRKLISALRNEGVSGLTLLDVGGGIGAIQLELLQAGASTACGIDAAPAYLDVAREEASRRGVVKRITYTHGDFAEMAEEVEAADIVPLDRVICCYPDLPGLVKPSVAKARRYYGIVYPRTHWMMRLACPIINLVSALRRCPLRFYLHAPAEIDRLVRDCGFEVRHESTTFLWCVVVYARKG